MSQIYLSRLSNHSPPPGMLARGQRLHPSHNNPGGRPGSRPGKRRHPRSSRRHMPRQVGHCGITQQIHQDGHAICVTEVNAVSAPQAKAVHREAVSNRHERETFQRSGEKELVMFSLTHIKYTIYLKTTKTSTYPNVLPLGGTPDVAVPAHPKEQSAVGGNPRPLPNTKIFWHQLKTKQKRTRTQTYWLLQIYTYLGKATARQLQKRLELRPGQVYS